MRCWRFVVLIVGTISVGANSLYPRESEKRDVQQLNGVWHYLQASALQPDEGVVNKWFGADLSEVRPPIEVSIPASSDVGKQSNGSVWYDRKFYAPETWSSDRLVWIHFEHVLYGVKVWLNGIRVSDHQTGHLGFQADITGAMIYGDENRLTVMCDNRFRSPQFSDHLHISAGIYGSVHVFTTSVVHIQSISYNTTYARSTGRIDFRIATSVSANSRHFLRIVVRDRSGAIVSGSTAIGSAELAGSVLVPNVRLWWPVSMHSQPGYLYTVDWLLLAENGVIVEDVYRSSVGIRTLDWKRTTQLQINGKPVYMRGYDGHANFTVIGGEKAVQLDLMAQMRWLGANAYRTSHYASSEQFLQLADKAGIMVVAALPSFSTGLLTGESMMDHRTYLEQVIDQRHNHPSIVIWSISMEARSSPPEAGDYDAYFGAVANHTRLLDPSRPVTAVIESQFCNGQAARHLDLIGLDLYQDNCQETLKRFDRHDMPIFMVDSGSGDFAERYRAYDGMRQKGALAGEFTSKLHQEHRRPNSLANLVRQRYQGISANEDEVCGIAKDWFDLVSQHVCRAYDV